MRSTSLMTGVILILAVQGAVHAQTPVGTAFTATSPPGIELTG